MFPVLKQSVWYVCGNICMCGGKSISPAIATFRLFLKSGEKDTICYSCQKKIELEFPPLLGGCLSLLPHCWELNVTNAFARRQPWAVFAEDASLVGGKGPGRAVRIQSLLSVPASGVASGLHPHFLHPRCQLLSDLLSSAWCQSVPGVSFPNSSNLKKV